jgi:magnesium chelatase family protein
MARKDDGMVAHINTVAFQGIEARDIDVQVSFSSGLPSFTIVGLPDKAVAESRERVRSAIGAMGLSLPPKRITVNLAPADILKEGSHFDLPIALGLLVAMDVIGVEDLSEYAALGELGLDGALIPVAGVLLAAVEANANGLGLICPEQNGAGAVWAGGEDVLGASSLLALVNHFKGSQIISPPAPAVPVQNHVYPDLRDIKGQEVAKRSLEVAAAGAHNLLLIGPPGSGKSMLAQRLPGILPPLEVREALTISMIASVVGLLRDGVVTLARPFRDPHHSASMPALVGGGVRTKPGEASLAPSGRAVFG